MKKANIVSICNGNEQGPYNWKRYLNQGYQYNKDKIIATSQTQYDWEDRSTNSFISFSSENEIQNRH